MRSIIMFLAIAFAAVPALAANSVKATIKGLVCESCVQEIEKAILKMDATKAVFVDFKRKIVLIEAKEGKSLDEKAISAALVDAGYVVVKMQASRESVDQAKAASREAGK
jgi:copper chaperone CopZ